MQGHPIAQTKKNCIDIQVRRDRKSAFTLSHLHTQLRAHLSILSFQFFCYPLTQLFLSYHWSISPPTTRKATTPLLSTLPIVIQTLKAQVNEQTDRFGDFVTPNLYADILITGTLPWITLWVEVLFVQHTTEPFPQKIDKGWTEYYVITKRQKKRWKMRKKNKEWQKVTEKKKWGKRKEKGVKLLSNIFWGTNFM